MFAPAQTVAEAAKLRKQKIVQNGSPAPHIVEAKLRKQTTPLVAAVDAQSAEATKLRKQNAAIVAENKKLLEEAKAHSTLTELRKTKDTKTLQDQLAKSRGDLKAAEKQVGEWTLKASAIQKAWIRPQQMRKC